MSGFGAWIATARKALIAAVTVAVGATIKLLPPLSIEMYALLAAIAFALVLIEEIITGVRPSARLREIAPVAMDAAAAPILNYMTNNGVTARMSMFKAVRAGRRLWMKRFFKVMWSVRMFGSPDVNISFPVSEGISGQCFMNKCLMIADSKGIEKYKLPPAYLAGGVGALRFSAILSYPVYEPKKDGMQSGNLIGVLNLDTDTANAHTTFMTASSDPAFRAHLDRLADLAGRCYR